MDEAQKFQLSAPRFARGPFQLIAGFGRHFTQGSAADIPELWAQLLSCIGKVPGQVGGETYGVCCNPDGKGGFEYIAGVAISKLDDLPEEYRWIELKEQEYAVFEHQGPLTSLGQTFQSIWNDWLPHSGREAADAPEFERYSADFDPQTGAGSVEIWLPLKRL